MLNVRQVQPTDIFAAIRLAYDNLPERYSPSIFNYFYESFANGFLVAEEYGKIIGFIIGVKTFEKSARILMLSVHSDYQKKGVGTKIVASFLEEMKRLNIKNIELEVRVNNLNAINFYKKLNFKIMEKIKHFYPNGEDAYIMKIELR